MDIKYGDFSFLNEGLPTPNISLSSEVNTTEAGAVLGRTLNITLNGQLYAGTGDPDHIAEPETFPQKMVKQIKSIEAGFGSDYKQLYIEGCSQKLWDFAYGETSNLAIQVDSVSFSNNTDDNWKTIVDYTIALRSENVPVNDNVTGVMDYLNRDTVGSTQADVVARIYATSPVTDITNSYSIQPITDAVYFMPNPSVEGKTFDQDFASYSGTMMPFASGIRYPGYTITRTLGAKGKRTQSKTAIENARTFVTGMLHYDQDLESVLVNMSIYDRKSNITASDLEGNYEIKDTFTAYSGTDLTLPKYTERFNIANNLDKDMKRTVSIKGNIKGLRVSNSSTTGLYWSFDKSKSRIGDDYLFPTVSVTDSGNNSAFAAASGRFNELLEDGEFYNRCVSAAFPKIYSKSEGSEYVFGTSSSITGYKFHLPPNVGPGNPAFKNMSGWLNPSPISTEIGHNPVDNSLDYTFTFDSRPANLIPGAHQESLEFEDVYGIRQYANQTRFKGMPLPQDLGTYTLPSRTVTYSARFTPQHPTTTSLVSLDTEQAINKYMNAFNPDKGNPTNILTENIGLYYYYSWISDQDIQMDPINGTYQKSVTWQYDIRYWGSRVQTLSPGMAFHIAWLSPKFDWMFNNGQ